MSVELLEPGTQKAPTDEMHPNTDENKSTNPCAEVLMGQSMPCVLPVPEQDESKVPEYLVVSDTTSEVIMASTDMGECRKMLTKIRKCNGQVTMYKAMNF